MKHQITEKAYEVLTAIKEAAKAKENVTAADLAGRLGWEKKSSVDGVVTGGLIRNRGLVERVEAEVELADGTHKVLKFIKPTPAGMAYNHEEAKAADEAEAAAAE